MPIRVLSAEAIEALTGYRNPTHQLATLHAAGYPRARLIAGAVLLTEAHYRAVESGAWREAQGDEARAKVRP